MSNKNLIFKNGQRHSQLSHKFREEKRKMINTHENCISLVINKIQGKATIRHHCPHLIS